MRPKGRVCQVLKQFMCQIESNPCRLHRRAVLDGLCRACLRQIMKLEMYRFSFRSTKISRSNVVRRPGDIFLRLI
jgi:hypothetical protein